MINLNGKVALITGGSRGIGAATAILLARSGCHIAFTYTSHRAKALEVSSQIKSIGKDCIFIRTDVSSERDVKKTVRSVLKRFRRIDILVNNAGIWKYGAIGTMSTRQWNETIDVNLKGTFLFCNEVARHMKTRGGKIINITSTAGQRGEAFHSHYAASKAAVTAFTKSIAVELAPFAIQVNCVAPGWVETDMTASTLRNRKSRRVIEESIPRGRVATAEEIAGPILFLASDLSNHLIGTTISVNGGGVMVD